MTTVKLLSSTKEPMELLKVAAGECYQSKTTDATIRHIVDAGHLSVLEHCYASFEVTCSILVLLQLTRHRHLSFTVQSSRGSELTEVAKTGNSTIDDLVDIAMFDYKGLLASGYAFEEAAYLLPKAAEYKLVVTGNFRAWFEYLPKRMCKRASEEHQQLANLIYHELMLVCPEVFGQIKLNCKTCKEKGCSFK